MATFVCDSTKRLRERQYGWGDLRTRIGNVEIPAIKKHPELVGAYNKRDRVSMLGHVCSWGRYLPFLDSTVNRSMLLLSD